MALHILCVNCVYIVQYSVWTELVSCYVVYDAFEHWKELVKLLCCAEDALSAHKHLFIAFTSW